MATFRWALVTLSIVLLLSLYQAQTFEKCDACVESMNEAFAKLAVPPANRTSPQDVCALLGLCKDGGGCTNCGTVNGTPYSCPDSKCGSITGVPFSCTCSNGAQCNAYAC
uniref:Uncharacterized protein n=1 Tax=Paramoeba aestuarina TaxID=180227 RepID=A0A7S4UHT7_9EUKA|mmetsp:Transcript_34617/g.54055  ORF Transcript_34617/g.54055 Transcript_34617/m.54055 type:complete len:110 (+) Transcript_34617:40-369(+)